jgi:hypothetical protein
MNLRLTAVFTLILLAVPASADSVKVSDMDIPAMFQQQPTVSATICDCGEMSSPPPKWIFALAAIPLVCVTGICSGHHHTTDLAIIPPSPAVPRTPVPEPTALLLLATGCLIGWRFRRGK